MANKSKYFHISILLDASLKEECPEVVWDAKVKVETGGADPSSLSCAAACLMAVAARRSGVGLERAMELMNQMAMDYCGKIKEKK